MKRWALLSGARGTGKSTTARRVAERLAERGVRVSGFYQEGVTEEGIRTAYRLRRIGAEGDLTLARLGSAAATGQEAFCSYVFDEGAFAEARRWLDEASSTAEILFIDEVSKLEVAGRGHHDTIVAALGGDRLVLLAVRADQLFHVMERFGLDEPVASLDTAERDDIEPFCDELHAALRGAEVP